MYDLGREGQQLSHVGRADVQERQSLGHGALVEDTTAPSPHLFDDKQRKNRKIVDVHVVSALESATVHAVCVDERASGSTSTQSRSTMTASSSTLSEDSLRPRALVLVHVRAPPPNNLWDEAGNGYWLLP